MDPRETAVDRPIWVEGWRLVPGERHLGWGQATEVERERLEERETRKEIHSERDKEGQRLRRRAREG